MVEVDTSEVARSLVTPVRWRSGEKKLMAELLKWPNFKNNCVMILNLITNAPRS